MSHVVPGVGVASFRYCNFNVVTFLAVEYDAQTHRAWQM